MDNTAQKAEHCDVAVIGAGPAGLAAAAAAAGNGARVVAIDDNPAAGGQIWRAGTGGPAPEAASRQAAAITAGAEILTGTTLVDIAPDRTLLLSGPEGVRTLRAEALILATGARELFLPFPGWTRPGVAGAGGLQALVKGGWPIEGARVVVAGSGPLLLAVADYLKRAGARVVMLAEQASFVASAALAPHLIAHPRKAMQALRLARGLAGVPRAWNSWPVRAEGEERLEAVVLQRGARQQRIECEYLACGFGLVPNVEVALHLGCQLANGGVVVDEWQHTSTTGVFAVGELCGIGGVDVALVEGEIAGHAATGNTESAGDLFDRRARERRFGHALEIAFALRPELKQLGNDRTVLCRCEDVTMGAAGAFANARDAKLKTRCGMGPCQGRICGAAGRFLFGWDHDRVRPPFFPVTVAALTEEVETVPAATP